ncbi:MAG: helix-turn-helix domain-containing protein [Thermoanaerobaculia bacterium]|nr:helix-turn-helix domain-containing protein [Thermoanaerobaculia bacterium]
MPDQEPKPHSELASFGEELRREREIRGISLREIADATKISKRFLEAIERNDHITLPAPVFTRGFVREYARYLGLNLDEIVNRYNFAASGDDRIEKTPHLDRLTHPEPPPLVRPVPPKKGIPPSYARILDRNVIILVFIVAALAGVSYWAVQHKRAQRERSREEAALATPAVVAPAAASLPQTTTTAASGQPSDDLLRLEVEAVSDSWLALDADGKSVFNDVMRTGTRQTFEAREQFRLRSVGNAAGLTLSLNGTRLQPLGAEGEVVKNRVFDREFLATANQNTEGSTE